MVVDNMTNNSEKRVKAADFPDKLFVDICL